MNRVRTPVEVSGRFFSAASSIRKEEGFRTEDTCYFISSDSIDIVLLARKHLGALVYNTSGQAVHNALSTSQNGRLKALADFILLGISDGIVHGMSSFSESAMEMTFNESPEIKCLSPHKKLWSHPTSWHCVRRDRRPSQRAIQRATHAVNRFQSKSKQAELSRYQSRTKIKEVTRAAYTVVDV